MLLIMQKTAPDTFSVKGFGRIGDVLSDAQAKLQQVYGPNVTCRTERVYFPGVDPNTGKNYYEQNICSTPGQVGAFMADVVAGGGVDLAAEKKYNDANHAYDYAQNSGQSYINVFGSAPNVQAMTTLNPDGTRTTGTQAPPTDFINVFDQNTAARAQQQQQQTTTAQTLTQPSKTQDLSIKLDLDSLTSGLGIDPKYLLIGGAALAALLLMKK